jgi:hypothetical protein
MRSLPDLPRPSTAPLIAPWLLGILTLGVILASLCIGVYPIPFGRVAQILGNMVWPFPLPDHAP